MNTIIQKLETSAMLSLDCLPADRTISAAKGNDDDEICIYVLYSSAIRFFIVVLFDLAHLLYALFSTFLVICDLLSIKNFELLRTC